MVQIERNVKLEQFTNTRTGGVVNNMYFPTNLEQLIDLVKTLKSNGSKFEVLGDMTNVAVASGQLEFDVINMSEYQDSEPKIINQRELVVGAGYKMMDLAYWSVKNRLKGLAWMEGIPGTVGAGIFMNAGFLPGQDIQTYLLDVTFLNIETMQVETLKNSDLKFRYRYSTLQEMDVIILEGRFLMTKLPNTIKGHLKVIKQKNLLRKYHKRRSKNQPLELPSAGTTFVPPTPWHVGGMLRELNLVGHKIGGAQISEKSPGFIVGAGEMTGEDYRDLVCFVQRRINDEYGVQLVPEVRFLGFRE